MYINIYLPSNKKGRLRWFGHVKREWCWSG